MLNHHQKTLYDEFYDSTHNNQYLDRKEEVLVGLAAAIAMNCQTCTEYYLQQARRAKIKKAAISEVIAKVMAVAAGQKRLQTQQVIDNYNINLDNFK